MPPLPPSDLISYLSSSKGAAWNDVTPNDKNLGRRKILGLNSVKNPQSNTP